MLCGFDVYNVPITLKKFALYIQFFSKGHLTNVGQLEARVIN